MDYGRALAYDISGLSMLRVHVLRLVFVPLACLAPACGDSKTPVKHLDGGLGDAGQGAGGGHSADAGRSSDAADGGNSCASILATCAGSDDVDGLGNLCLRVASKDEVSTCAAVASECLAYCAGETESSGDAGDLDVAQCKAMGDTCHDFDTGTGLGNLCHEVGHSGNLAWCSAIYDDCVALCGEPTLHDEDAGSRVTFDLRFAAKVGAEDFECGRQYSNVGTAHSTITPVDLRLYVSNIRLVTQEGEQVPVTVDEIAPYQGGGVALLDFSDGAGSCRENDTALNTAVRVSAPAGTYTGVAFSTSVPLELNHRDPLTLPAPFQDLDMTWGWLAGFKFLKLEFQTVSTRVTDAGTSNPTDAGVGDAPVPTGAIDAGTGIDAGTRVDASADANVSTSNDDPTTSSVDTAIDEPVLTILHIGSVACSDSSSDADAAPNSTLSRVPTPIATT